MAKEPRTRDRKRPARDKKPEGVASSSQSSPSRLPSDAAELLSNAERDLAAPTPQSLLLIPPGLVIGSEPGKQDYPAPWIRDSLQDVVDWSEIGVEIVMPPAGELRARPIVIRSRRLMTGAYQSWKMDRPMEWESIWESNVFRLLDACPAIERFAEQPFTIRYLIDGVWHLHVPDVAVQTRCGKRLILEVKSTSDRRVAEAIERARILTPRLETFGCGYAVVHERDIARGRTQENADLLLKFGRGAPSAIEKQQFTQLLAGTTGLSRQALLGKVIDGHHAICAGSKLAIRGEISLNWLKANSEPLKFLPKSQHNEEESLTWLLQCLGVTKAL